MQGGNYLAGRRVQPASQVLRTFPIPRDRGGAGPICRSEGTSASSILNPTETSIDSRALRSRSRAGEMMAPVPAPSVRSKNYSSQVGINQYPTQSPPARVQTCKGAGRLSAVLVAGPAATAGRHRAADRIMSIAAISVRWLSRKLAADLDAELEQFAVDAGRAPEGVGQAHLTIRSRISVLILGRLRRRDLHRQ